MPLYDFKCEDCGTAFEARTAVDGPAPVCPDCGSTQTQRVISGFAIGVSFLRPTGRDAKRVDAQRAARETQRLERKEQRKADRAQRGDGS